MKTAGHGLTASSTLAMFRRKPGTLHRRLPAGQKRLKHQRGRKLSSDDIEHYQRIIVVLKTTREVMQEVDQQ
jgi:hypothetical protein